MKARIITYIFAPSEEKDVSPAVILSGDEAEEPP